MPAFFLLLLALAPVASASHGEPDETIPLVPFVDESTPDSLFVPETCDPLNLVICVGPFNGTVPVGVGVASDGVDLVVWLHDEESESVGPVHENVTLPFVGTLPVTICPNTCPVPVPPEADALGSITFVVTVMDDACAVTLHSNGTFESKGACPPLPNGGEDGDSDGVPDAADPDPTDPYDPFFWRAPCDDDRSPEGSPFSVCKMDDGRYKVHVFATGTTIESGLVGLILDNPTA